MLQLARLPFCERLELKISGAARASVRSRLMA